MVTGIKSAELKLIRAAKHLRAIKRCTAKYAASKPHKIIVKAKGKKKLNIPKSPPNEICILVGEMVYQMRSALDHLAFDLVKRNHTRTPLPKDWEGHCQFPLFPSVPTHGNPKIAYSFPVPQLVFSSAVPNISVKAYTFIESVQPYYRNTAASNVLRFLRELSNIDKHRYLHIIRPRAQQSQSIRYGSGLSGQSVRMLDRGAKIEAGTGWDKTDRAVYVSRRYRMKVAFQERTIFGDAADLQVEYLLKLILDIVKRDIVPQMKKLINAP